MSGLLDAIAGKDDGLYWHFHRPEAGGHARSDHPLSHTIFSSHRGPAGGVSLRDPHNPAHRATDEALLRDGILDPQSFLVGYLEQQDPIRILVHGPDGRIKHIRHAFSARPNPTHEATLIAHLGNLRTNYGGSLLLKMLTAADGTGTTNTPNAYYGNQATITYTATAVTPGTSPAWTVDAYKDHIVVPYAGGVYGVVLTNSATALTVDQWTAIGAATTTNPVTGAAGTTPPNNTPFVILPGAAPVLWVALSTDATAPNTTDTSLASEVTTGGMGRKFAGGGATAYSTVTTAPAGSSTSANQTAASKLHVVWTATGTVASIQKAGIFVGAITGGGGTPAYAGTFVLFGVSSGDSVTYDHQLSNT